MEIEFKKFFNEKGRVLSAREKCIYDLRAKGITYLKISKMFNVCPQRIRQIYIKTLKKISGYAEDKEFGNYPKDLITKLKLAGVKSKEEAENMTDSELLSLKGIGWKRLKFIRGGRN